MKKIVALLLAGLMVVTMSVSVFAANSVSANGDITGATGGTISAPTNSASGAYDATDVTATAGATVTLKVSGVTSSYSGYIQFYYNGAWIKLAATFGKGTVSFTAPGNGTAAIFITSTGSGSSPKTGSDNMALYLGLMGVAALAGAVLVSKKKAA